MAVKLDTITHGQSSWDKSVNGNFDKLNQDSGLIPLVMVGSVKALYADGNGPMARRVNGIIHMTRGVVATDDIAVNTVILTYPDQFEGADGGINAFCQVQENQQAVPVLIIGGNVKALTAIPKGTKLDFSGITYLGKDMN